MDVAGGRGEECITGSYAIEYVGTVLASGTVLRGSRGSAPIMESTSAGEISCDGEVTQELLGVVVAVVGRRPTTWDTFCTR